MDKGYFMGDCQLLEFFFIATANDSMLNDQGFKKIKFPVSLIKTMVKRRQLMKRWP
jgi:hypothetical protein